MNKQVKACHARLSAGGKIAALIGLALCAAPVWAEGGIQAQNSTTQVVQAANQVDVVNIAKPNAQGLSHNQYSQFNVGKQGAVLNNALQDGKSQLAGQLGKNPNFANQAASVILNEVVAKNPSLLAGQQEVFGMAADYVLANPSGITCDGCGFINTPRASLVVGKPNIENDQLVRFQVQGDAENEGGIIKVRQGISGTDILDLIAPRVDIDGDVRAVENINVLMGNRVVDYAGNATNNAEVAVERAKKEGEEKALVLDGQIFGSMQANRIRIHNSDPAAKTDIKANINAKNSLRADVRGNLHIADSQLKANTIELKGKNLTVDGKLAVDNGNSSDVKDTGFLQQKHTEEKWQKETFSQTQIKGADIAFDIDDAVVLNAVNIEADNALNIQANDVQMNSVKANQATVKSVKDSKLSWFNQQVDSEYVRDIHGNTLKAGKVVSIKAKGMVDAKVLDVQAASVDIHGAQGVSIDGTQSRVEKSAVNRYQNETAKLKTGEHEQSTSSEQWVGSRIQGNQVHVQSDRDIHLNGTDVQGGQSTNIAAAGKVVVGTGSTASAQKDVEHFTYWGGIGGGATNGEQSHGEQQHISQVQGAMVEIDGQKGVALIASNVRAENAVALKSKAGEVQIKHAENQQASLRNQRHGTAFNITDKNHKEETQKSTSLSAQVRGTDVLIDADSTQLLASNVQASNDLRIDSQHIHTDAASNQERNTTQDYALGLKGYAQKKGAVTDFKGKAGVRLQGVTVTEEKQKAQVVANTLKAKNIHLNGDKQGEIHLQGSQVTGNQLTISSGKITNDAALVQTSGDKKVTETSGGGIYISGSLEKIAIGLEAGTDQVHHTQTEKTAVSSRFDIKNDVVIKGKEIHNIGTQIQAGGKVALQAGTVENVEAHHVKVDKLVNGKGGVDLSVYAKTSPTVGAALILSGEGDGEEITTSSAVSSAIQAQQIAVNGSNLVKDRGTQYQSANDVVIEGKEYQGLAAEDTVVSVGNVGQAELGLKVYTGTFQDVTAELGANTAYKHIKKGTSKAVMGNMVAKNNVHIHADKLASAMNIKAGNDVQLKGEDVAITQANNRKTVLQGGFNLGGSAGATFVPAASGVGVTPSFSANGGINYLKVEDTQAVQAQVEGQNVLMQGQKAARVEGANIRAKNQFSMTGDVSQFNEAYDSHQATGVQTSGNAALKLSMNGEGVSGGSAGLGGNLSVIEEKSRTAQSGSIDASEVQIFANSADLPLLVSAARIRANDVTLTNQAGEVAVLAAESKTHKGNWGLGGNLGAGGNAESGVTSFNVGGHLNVDTEDSQHYQKGLIQGKQVNINSAKNTSLQTDINADVLNINAEDAVRILGAQDKTGIFALSVGAHVGGSPAQINAETSIKDVASVLKDDFENGTVLGVKVDGKLKMDINDSQNTQKSIIKANALNVSSGSQSVLVNASDVQAASGSGFGSAKVQKTDNTDYTHDLGFFVSVETPNFQEMISNAIDGKKVESPFQADSHLNWKKKHVVQSEVNIK